MKNLDIAPQSQSSRFVAPLIDVLEAFFAKKTETLCALQLEIVQGLFHLHALLYILENASLFFLA